MSAPRPVRRARLIAAPLFLTALLSGCRSGDAPAHPDAQSAPVTTAAAPAAPSTAAPTSTAPSLAAELAGSKDGRPASLAVTVGAVQAGVPPLPVAGGLAADCQLDPAATEYAEVNVVFTSRFQPTKQTGVSSNLRFDLGVDDGAGVLPRYATTPDSYCDGSPTVPAAAVLQSQDLADEHQTLTAYVIAGMGADGADPLAGATLELRDLRHHPDDIDGTDWTWEPQDVVGGSTCPGDPGSLCVPLG